MPGFEKDVVVVVAGAGAGAGAAVAVAVAGVDVVAGAGAVEEKEEAADFAADGEQGCQDPGDDKVVEASRIGSTESCYCWGCYCCKEKQTGCYYWKTVDKPAAAAAPVAEHGTEPAAGESVDSCGEYPSLPSYATCSSTPDLH